MAEISLQSRTDEDPGKTDTTTPKGGEHQDLGSLFREATRLLEAADLPGANEALKTAEQVLVLRRQISNLSPR